MAARRRKARHNPTQMLEALTALLGDSGIMLYKNRVVLMGRKKKRKRKPSPLQQKGRQTMKEAVFFAKRIISDPVQKAAWKKRAKGYTNVYQAAVAWYNTNENKKPPVKPPKVV